MFPNLSRHAPYHRKHEYLSMRRGSWSPSPRPPSRSPSPPDIPLTLPPSYRKQRPQQPNHLSVTDAWLFRGIRTRVEELALAEVVAFDGAVAARNRTQVVCEYTWVETMERGGGGANKWPAVYVPGNARIWRGIPRGHVLTQAKRSPTVRDEHAQRQPLFPYEPTFRALAEAQIQAQAQDQAQPPFRSRDAGRPDCETIRFRAVEVISDADTLAQLFGFISSPIPSKTAPFRLELSTVRNTLFLSRAEHPRRGHTAKRGRVPAAVPDWVSDAVTSAGTQDAPVPFGGGHWRVVRYRLGGIVCMVRAKVDFVYEHRQAVKDASLDPMRGVEPEMADSNTKEGKVDTWKTTVTKLGHRFHPGASGRVTVRSRSEDAQRKLAQHMPALWFGRVPFVIDAAVSPELEVVAAQLLSTQDKYGRWEEKHQASLQRMAGLLKKLKQVTRGLGGSCVLVADPSQRCFVVMKPVLKRMPIPEEVAMRFWGEDEKPAITEYESTVESAMSELSELSRTPSGFEDWKLDSDTDTTERKRLGADLAHRPYKRPRIDPMGRVNGWLKGETNNQEHDTSSRDDDESSESLRPIGPYDSISIRGSTSHAKNPGPGHGFDGAMEYEGDAESEGGDQGDQDGDTDGSEDGDTSDDEAGDQMDESSDSDWADGNVSDRDLYKDASDGVVDSSPSDAGRRYASFELHDDNY